MSFSISFPGITTYLQPFRRAGTIVSKASSSICAVSKRMGRCAVNFAITVNIRYMSTVPLLRAAELGHIETARSILQQDHNIDVQDDAGRNALMYASVNGHTEMVRFLLTQVTQGTDINAQDTTAGRYTPLMLAATNGHIDTVRLLLQKGANVNLQNYQGTTALMMAARSGYTDIVRLIAANNTSLSLSLKDIHGDTVLTSILQSTALTPQHKLELIQILESKLTRTLNVRGRNGQTALYMAVDQGLIDIVQYLLGSGANLNIPNLERMTPLMRAAGNNNFEMVAMLINRGVDDINAQDQFGDTALSKAMVSYRTLQERNINRNIVEFLLGRGASVSILDTSNNTLLMKAVNADDIDIVRLILNREHSVEYIRQANEDGETALQIAAARGNIAIANLLLERGALINDLPIDNDANAHFTALMMASVTNQVEMVRFLLNTHADPNIQTEGNMTALMLAAINGRTEVVRLLLANHANLNLRNAEGNTPLMLAAMNGHTEVVRLLLANHANLNLKNNERETVLTAVLKQIGLSRQKKLEVVRALTEGTGIDLNEMANDQTALHIATEQDLPDIVLYLLQNGANPNTPDLSFGRTPLIHAVMRAPLMLPISRTIRILISHSDLEHQDDSHKRAIDYAVERHHTEMFSLLIENFAEDQHLSRVFATNDLTIYPIYHHPLLRIARIFMPNLFTLLERNLTPIEAPLPSSILLSSQRNNPILWKSREIGMAQRDSRIRRVSTITEKARPIGSTRNPKRLLPLPDPALHLIAGFLR